MAKIALRPLEDADLDTLFGYMRDPVAVRMAAFTRQDPDDRAAFDEHRARISARPDVLERAITRDGDMVGHIASFVSEGETEITYWVDRAAWGQGVAGQAIEAFLRECVTRPVFARAAADNVGSLRVLQRAGFVEIGTGFGFANARHAEIEEKIFRLG